MAVKGIQAVRGMIDHLPASQTPWQLVEDACKQVCKQYAYAKISLPIVEKTELFKRTIGDVTDIVEKEMYTFEDRNGDSLSLRPEGTAGCVRAGIQHGLLYRQVQRLWYMGPMFRHERPQKGRYRQFTHFGVEAFGLSSPAIDAELIAMNAAILRNLNLLDSVELQINSLGTSACRKAYKEKLVNYLEQHSSALDDDSKRRLTTNPLRILDSKNPALTEIIANAPQLRDSLCKEALAHHAQLCAQLDLLGINFIENPHLVRGLDYYGLTVFEWVTTKLGAQGTVSAGGRYDGLVAQLGGEATPAVGFAIGLDRLVALLEDTTADTTAPDFYIIPGAEAMLSGVSLQLAEEMRKAYPLAAVEVDLSDTNFKKKLKRTRQSGAKVALIIGDDEVASDSVIIKSLTGEQDQLKFTRAEFLEKIADIEIGEN